jgi:signaling repeat-containing protein
MRRPGVRLTASKRYCCSARGGLPAEVAETSLLDEDTVRTGANSMVGTYTGWLVVLSVVVAIVASYVALDLASRVSAWQRHTAAWYWQSAGAISQGSGIWSMHFVGMLAFRLPIPMSMMYGSRPGSF